MSEEIEDPATLIAQRTAVAQQAGIDPVARRLYLIGEIHEDALHRFLPAFQVLDSTDGAIQIILSSPGGAEAVGWAIYDVIKAARNPVVIDGYGGVYSIAASILQAATYRRLTPQTRFMIHNGSVLIDGGLGANEAVGMGHEVAKNNDRYHRALAERSSLTVPQIAELCREDSYFDAAEAIKLGFADGIVPSQKPTPKRKKK